MKTLPLFFLLLIFSVNAPSADISLSQLSKQFLDLKITGTIINEKGEVIPFADIALLDHTKKVIFLGQSDPSGRFVIENAPEGTYKIVLSRLGCQTKEYDITVSPKETELGELILEEGIALQEATITAERSYISSKVDRLVYSVEDDQSRYDRTG